MMIKISLIKSIMITSLILVNSSKEIWLKKSTKMKIYNKKEFQFSLSKLK
jgi:hypothetical protein